MGHLITDNKHKGNIVALINAKMEDATKELKEKVKRCLNCNKKHALSHQCSHSLNITGYDEYRDAAAHLRTGGKDYTKMTYSTYS